MRFNSSSLFVNTGKKPLNTMQKRKNMNRNNVLLSLCVAIIAVLCIFVGLIVRVWLGYNEDEKASAPVVVQNAATDTAQKTDAVTTKTKITVKKETAKNKKSTTKETAKKSTEKTTKKAKKKSTKKSVASKYNFEGTEGTYSKAIDKAFANFDGAYAYGFVTLGDGTRFIRNTDKIESSTAVAAFLAEYICAKIYTGEFDYDTYVDGYSGEQLIDMLTSNGSVEAANLLINHFTPQKLNAYMESKGYTSTHFGGTIESANANGNYTSISDLMNLMQTMNNKSGIFPYSDIFRRMRNCRVTSRIRNQIPSQVASANISLAFENEMFDLATIFGPTGNYIFASVTSGYKDDGTLANTAIAEASKNLYYKINP